MSSSERRTYTRPVVAEKYKVKRIRGLHSMWRWDGYELMGWECVASTADLDTLSMRTVYSGTKTRQKMPIRIGAGERFVTCLCGYRGPDTGSTLK